ncbi:MAG: RICIN domain-containing protein [Nakamurella sp.]
MALTVAAVMVGALGVAVAGAPSADAAVDPGAYSVSVGSTGSWTKADDTPAASFIDKDGTYYFQQSHSLYGATAGRAWSFYSGSNIDTAKRSPISDAVNPANPQDSNADTTWRCNNSPTGVNATAAPSPSGYSQPNYCDLAGVWVDPDTGDWYGLVHNEFTPQPFGDGLHFDAIDYARSIDQGKTWSIVDHAITSPYSTTRGDTAAFPQQTYDYGDGDPRLVVDTASGYFYVFYGSRIVNKGGSWAAFYEHAARAPISSKMATGSWQKWYDGSWKQPGVGGKESNVVPTSAGSPTGYTPTAQEYNPNNTGSVSQQVAAGKTPPTSPLFVMDVTYDAYLGLYIGEPQAVDQSGKAPQQYYATDNLATQKWTLIGDTGSYTTASWYRWFIDPANKTNSSIVGKDFRSYCSFGCSSGKSSEYANVTIDSAAPASPVDTSKVYRIGSARRLLAQVSGSTSTTSVRSDNGLAAWRFGAVGDGSYTVTNAATGQLLGVPSTSASTRAWGTQPTATTADGNAKVGQQWFVVPNTSARSGKPTGTVRLVNRYSGLVLAVSADKSRAAETTPGRSWTDTSGSTVGDGRNAAQQTLRLTSVGAASYAPTLKFVTPKSGHKVAGTIPVTVKLGGAALQAYNLRVDSAGLQYAWQPTAGNQRFKLHTRTLSNGVHTLLATATDQAGNNTAITEKITVRN